MSRVLRIVPVLLAGALAGSCAAVADPPPGLRPLAASVDDRDRLASAERLHDDALARLQADDLDGAHRLVEEATRLQEATQGPDHPELAHGLTTLGLVLHEKADLAAALAVLERALRIRRDAFGAEHHGVAESLTNVARVLYAQGQFSRARPLLDEAVRTTERTLGVSHPRTAVSLTHLAVVHSQLGDLVGARTAVARAVAILDQSGPEWRADLATALNVAGNIAMRSGAFAEARRPLERSLQLREQTFGPEHRYVARTLTRLGILAAQTHDPDAALSLLERALAINERAFGAMHPEVAGSLNEVGRIRRLLKDHPGAQARFERALRIQEQTIGPMHPFVAVTLRELAAVRLDLNDATGARLLLRRALLVQERSLGADHAFVADTLTSLGYLEARTGDYAEADRLLGRALGIRRQALAPRHPDVTQSLVDVARVKHAAGALVAARALYEQARRNLVLVGRTNEGFDETSLGRIWRAQLDGLQDYALLLSTIAADAAQGASASAIAEAFLVAQQARDWIVQSAVASALAERQAGTSVEAGLARRVAALRRARQTLWNDLAALYGEAREIRDDGEVTRLKAELQRIEQELDGHVERLRETFPRYAELAVPEPLDVAGVQRLLTRDEALVMLYSLTDRVQVWVVRADRPVVYRVVAVPRTVIQRLVDGIRASVIPMEGGLPAFDVESAATLYRLLLQPIATALAGIPNLLIVPDAVLLPVPFPALLTAMDGNAYARAADWHRRRHVPSGEEHRQYGALAWLAASWSLTVLPSASTLQLIRDGSRARPAPLEPFIGMGDPVLRGDGASRSGAMPAMRGARVPVDALHALRRLPGAGQELVSIARALATNPDTHVFAGPRATETMLRRLHAEGRLGRAGVLAFATHGLLAGELQGLHQPALVLTPPDTPTDDDDGLLSLEEVLDLDLSGNQLVVLSACNTAGSDGSGESLSGLARAFFFAGSRGLLVSQWPVGDRAAQALMTDAFRRYGADRGISAAEALRQAMLAMMQDGARNAATSYLAHPFAWAAFSLVGDPRSRQ